MWHIEIDAKADKELSRIGSVERQRILRFLRERLSLMESPRDIGEALTGTLSGFWKYRVGDYRIVAQINDRQITIVVVRVGNRREVYR